ncbi:MAG: ROK family protein [Bdellovibrionaceae bacterium]|nr:ROK family protein [Pseudobdellovibrionaceae bacterium]
MKKGSQKFSIGLDLGGTKLAAALVDSNGVIIDHVKVPVDMNREGAASKTQKRILILMTDIVAGFVRRFPSETSPSHFWGIGLASAGPLNSETGTLIYPVNFPGWKIVPIQRLLSSRLKKSRLPHTIFFQNDAVAAALAEGWIGAAKSMKSYAVITVGTGIGTGVIFNSRPVQTSGMGSEFGHLLVDLFGYRKEKIPAHHTIEGIASGTALVRRAKDLGFNVSGVEALVEKTRTQPKLLTLFDDMSLALAALCYNLSIGFNLQGLFFSGGLTKISSLFFPRTKSEYKNLIRRFNPRFEAKISLAKTGNKAGVVGAAYLPHLR